MNLFKLSFKIIGQVIFVIIFFSTIEAKSSNKFNNADRVSDYFSGILLLNDNQYADSFRFLKKLNGLEESHTNYSTKYLYTLVNSGNLNEAFNYSKKLEKQKLDSFESNLIIGFFYLKNSNLKLAKKYFLQAKNMTNFPGGSAPKPRFFFDKNNLTAQSPILYVQQVALMKLSSATFCKHSNSFEQNSLVQYRFYKHTM